MLKTKQKLKSMSLEALINSLVTSESLYNHLETEKEQKL